MHQKLSKYTISKDEKQAHSQSPQCNSLQYYSTQTPKHYGKWIMRRDNTAENIIYLFSCCPHGVNSSCITAPLDLFPKVASRCEMHGALCGADPVVLEKRPLSSWLTQRLSVQGEADVAALQVDCLRCFRLVPGTSRGSASTCSLQTTRCLFCVSFKGLYQVKWFTAVLVFGSLYPSMLCVQAYRRLDVLIPDRLNCSGDTIVQSESFQRQISNWGLCECFIIYKRKKVTSTETSADYASYNINASELMLIC